MMRVTVKRNPDGRVVVSSSELASSDVLAMVGTSDLVRARMRRSSSATFEVQVRSFPCTCKSVPMPCACAPSAEIVEVGERVA